MDRLNTFECVLFGEDIPPLIWSITKIPFFIILSNLMYFICCHQFLTDIAIIWEVLMVGASNVLSIFLIKYGLCFTSSQLNLLNQLDIRLSGVVVMTL